MNADYGLQAVSLMGALLRTIEADPASRFAWLPLQHEYMHSTRRYRLLRTGNQTVGKTTVAMYDLVQHAADLPVVEFEDLEDEF